MSEYIVRMPPDMPYEIKAELNAWYVNSEPIVRCRDCAKWATEKRFTGGCCGAKGDADPNGFCSWGERKDA